MTRKQPRTELMQRARRYPERPSDALGVRATRYIPIAGTGAYSDPWYCDDNSMFARMMRGAGFAVVRAVDGRPFRWSTDIDGLKFWARRSQWEAGADALVYFMEYLPVDDRNVIAHSHGGQLALLAAASGLQLRTLTTIGTPVRNDVPSREAAKNIGFWQHIYDKEFDRVGWMGAWFDGRWSADRTFKDVEGVHRLPLSGIDHSKVLHEDEHISKWLTEGWAENIRLDHMEAA
jgi:pimeloyl-ACP methyl ester carboxylesterase